MISKIILISLLVNSILSVPINFEETESDDNLSNDYYTNDENCLCLNGGYCVLDNDFCVCQPGFTGRQCEVKIESDNSNNCGNLLNGESEILDCAKCTCNRRVLTCEALSSSRCDYKKIINVYNLNITLSSNNLMQLK
ncbi:unnamed protein product, partial [Brachionus calyciflorus]